jgi:hypothetical protein
MLSNSHISGGKTCPWLWLSVDEVMSLAFAESRELAISSTKYDHESNTREWFENELKYYLSF